MTSRGIDITDRDMKRLRELLETARRFNSHSRAALDQLETELERAQVVASDQIPADVITMHSTARLIDVETGEEMVYTLVYPHEADIDQHRISVLAPIGIAILGYRVGDSLEWQVPEGLSRLKVKEVIYQPEASGVEESEQVNFELSNPAKWQGTLEKLIKSQEVFDDYTYP